MLVVIEDAPDVFRELPYRQDIVVGKVTHPWQIVDLWSDSELKALNIYRVVPAVVPAYSTVTSYSFQRIAGIVTQVLVTVLNTRKEAIDTDTTRLDLLTRLRNATPAQISAYVDNNVTDLASARALFKKILLVLSEI